MNKKPLSHYLRLSTFAGTLLLLAARPAAAANDVWTGGAAPDGNWTTAGNWGGFAPSPLDQLTFTGVQTLATNTFAAGTIFNSLTFDANAGSFLLSGNSLVLTNGADATGGLTAGGSITNLSANAQTNTIPITLSAGRHNIFSLGAGKLNLNGAITRNAGALVVFTNVSGGINVAGGLSTNGQNNILGGWATIGNDWATLDANSNVVAFTGYTTSTGGAIANNAAANVKLTSDGAAYTAANGTTVNSILAQLTGANRNVTITGTMKLGSKGGVYRSLLAGFNPTVTGGLLTAAGGGELTFSDGPFTTTGNNLTINSIVSNDTPNVVSVNVLGYVALGAANTYSGGTYISQGRVQLGNNASLGTGPVYVYPGGEVSDNGKVPTNNFYLSGVGTTENGGLGAIRMNGQTLVGTITLLGNTALGANGVNVLMGNVTGPGGLIIGSGSSANGNGSIAFGATNDYAGDTMICNNNSSAADILKISGSTMMNAMPHGPGKGNLILNARSGTATATFDVGGSVETVNGLTNTLTSPANDFVTDNTGGGTLIVGDNNASATFSGIIQSSIGFTKIGTGTQTLTGPNSYSGNTLVEGGTLAVSGTGSIIGSPFITVSNATLDVSGQTAAFTLASYMLTLSSNSTLVVSMTAQPTIGTLNLTNSTIQTAIPLLPITNLVVSTLVPGGPASHVNITAMPGVTSYPQQYALIQYGSNQGDATTLALGTMPSTYTGFISNDTVNSIIWLVATGGPVAKATVWNGNVSGNWDTTTLNWLTGTATNYLQGDFVTFDDTLTGTPSVNLTTGLAPFSLLVSNSAVNYVFNGTGKITGTTGLTKQGTGSLLLDNSGVSDFSGVVEVDAGTIQVGNGDANGSLGAGAFTNGGALAVNRTDNYTNINAISGSGSIGQNGSGTLTLSGANAAFTGPILVTQGTLKAGTGAALGTADGSTTVNSGAVLDVNAQTLTNEPVIVSGTGLGGAGAIINGSATAQQNALTSVTLTANTTVGGTGRWDIRGTGAALNLAGFTLTKTGSNQISVVNAVIGDGNLVINQGILDLETANGQTLAGAGTVTVNAGGSLGVFSNPGGSFLRAITLNGGSIRNGGGTLAAIDAPIALTANSTLDPNGANPGTVINSAITEAGGSFGLTKISAGSFFLGGANNYSGPTLVLAGTLALTNGGTIASSSLISVSNATLDVAGETVNPFTLATNNVAIMSNSVFNVGSSGQPDIGILSLTNATIRLVAVNYSQIGIIATNLNLGAATNFISLVSFATPPVPVQFPLVQYGSLTGTFNVGLALPAGYAGYLSNNIANKSIDLVLTASLSTAVWNGGDSAADNYWSDAVNWSGTPLLLNNPLEFSGGAGLNNTNDMPPANSYASINFDSGPYVLNGNPVTLLSGGGITNNTGSLQTINLGLNTASTNLTLVGNGGLIIGGGLTNNGIASETVTLFGSGTISNLLATPGGGGLVFASADSSGNWSILDNGAGMPITLTNGGFSLNGGATLNFGSAASAPNLTFAGGADNGVGNAAGVTTFNMINGTLNLPARINTQGNPGGAVNVLGGILNISNQMQIANGSFSDVSAVTISGGATTLNGGSGTLYVASRGAGTVTMSGGTLNCGKLDLSRNASGTTGGSAGVFNLNGGVVQAASVSTLTANSQAGSAPTALFNFNGGTLMAKGNATAFYQGNVTLTPVTPITSIVQAGGAIIDDGGFAIGVLEPLQHDSNLGAAPDGGLLKKGAGTLTLAAACTYTGNTVISNGTLAVNGSLAQTAVRVASGTLAGTGSVGGNVAVSANGKISPAGSGVTGALTIVGNLTLQGVTAVDINQAGATSDVINAGTVTYGGTLAVTNLAGVLTTNDTFKLFNAASYTGAFAAITPAAPAPGFGWNTNTLATDGVLRFVQVVNPIPTNITTVVSGNTLTLSWPADRTGWRLQVQTNSLGAGLNTNWFDVAGSTATNNVNTTLDPANGTVFYRMVYP